MGRLIIRFLLVYLTLFCSVLLYLSDAYAFDVLKLDDASVQYEKLHPSARHPMFTFSRPKERISVRLDTSVLDHFYWNSYVHGTSDESQYRFIGLEMEVGLRVTKWASVHARHHSQHLLDTTYAYGKWPVEDALGFTLHLYRAPANKGSLF